MPYATQDDIIASGVTEAELIQLTDDDNTHAIDATKVDAAIADGSSTVESSCRQRYTLPLQPSAKVTSLVVDLAVYALFKRRRRVPDAVKQASDDAVAFLKDVAAGKASLDQPAGATPQQSGGEAVPPTQEQKFSDDNLAGFA